MFSLSALNSGTGVLRRDPRRAAPLHNPRPDKGASSRGDFRYVFVWCLNSRQREPAIYRCHPRLFELINGDRPRHDVAMMSVIASGS